ncbi:MAG: Tudor-knot domain-containing protein [Candidatus Poseidoniaceae archaeon]|nr:Tudor-knot domain-containing protein [Candidatus Poseidoniaceae archaeon]
MAKLQSVTLTCTMNSSSIMADTVYSPDGKFMWTGSEWIPAPPSDAEPQSQASTNVLNMQDSVMSGDIVHNTVVNNDPAAVTSAVIEALKQLGVLDQQNATAAPVLPVVEIELPASFQVGDHVEYHSPTNARWLDRCTVIGINPDGTYRVEVPKDGVVEVKSAVIIGTSPGTIRPANPPLEKGDKVLVNWKNYGTYYPGIISKEYDDHTFLILYDDGDVEDRVDWSRIESVDSHSKDVHEYIQHQSSEREELIEAFQVFDPDGSGTISAEKYFEILTQIGDSPLSESDVLEEFDALGIQLDAEIDYRDLVKLMIGGGEGNPAKAEVVIRDAEVRDGVLLGHAYAHPKLGEGPIRSSTIISIAYDERATAHIETQNTLYVVGPTGWKEIPNDHPFNDMDNHFYTVQGAGTSKCNGTYIPATDFDGVPSYINGDILLLRWKMGNGDQWWYLADRNSLDSKRGDFYRVKSSSDFPPQTGWVVDGQTCGEMPCPTVVNSQHQMPKQMYSAGQQVKVEWNGSWWDALIREQKDGLYLIHYVGFDSSWDEWVDSSRIKSY